MNITRNMSFSISRFLPAAFLPPPSRWGCGVLDEAVELVTVAFDPAVTVGAGRLPRVINVGVTIDVEVMMMTTGVFTSVDTTTDVEVVSGVMLMDVVVEVALVGGVLLVTGADRAVELGSTVVGGGLGLFTILKSALYIIDSIGTWETKRRMLFKRKQINRQDFAMTNAGSKTH